MRNKKPNKQESELIHLEGTLGLPNLDQPSALADLAAQAREDPLGWIKIYAPKLLARHIVKLTILGESVDPRIRGSALKAAGDLTIRAIGLLGNRGRTNEIACLEEVPEWNEVPRDLRQRLDAAFKEYEKNELND